MYKISYSLLYTSGYSIIIIVPFCIYIVESPVKQKAFSWIYLSQFEDPFPENQYAPNDDQYQELLNNDDDNRDGNHDDNNGNDIKAYYYDDNDDNNNNNNNDEYL